MVKAIFTTFILTLMTGSICAAQEVDNDIKGNSIMPDDSVPGSHILLDRQLVPVFPNRDLRNMQPSLHSPFGVESDSISKEYNTYMDKQLPGTAIFPMWKNCAFVSTGSMSSYPGLMEIHSGSAGFVQDYGKVSLYIGAEANKYGYFNGLHTQYCINGSIQYSVSPSLTLTGYATYYFGRPPLMPNGRMMPPAMIGYYGVSSFGGTVEFQFNETFGLIVGGEAVQQFGTNKYRFEPIVTPTFKIGKIKFGIPVGQMANDIIRSYIHEKRRR